MVSEYSIEFATTAVKELDKIQRNYQVRIVKAIAGLAADPRPNGCTKLSGTGDGYRIRIGDYRVVYTVNDAVAHRQDREDRSSQGGVPVTISRDYELNGGLGENRVPISEARAQLSALVKRSADHDIILMNHGRPAAVLMSPEHYRALLDELDELQDRLAVQDSDDAPGVPFGHVLAELGLADDVAQG